MELKWTIKVLSDLARLYEFLASVKKLAAARWRSKASKGDEGRSWVFMAES